MEVRGEVRFKVNLSDDGTSKLSDRLTLALKDYMGDYVDDTLVKYVIVLLGNGRSKEEVKVDLDVFLGDNSDSFVSWLWDHLASHLDQYVQPPMPSTNEAAKAKPDLVEHNAETDSQQLVSDSDKEKLKSSRSRHNKDWKGLMSDESHSPLRSSVTNDTQKEEKVHNKVVRAKPASSPEHPVNRKRNRADERPRSKVVNVVSCKPASSPEHPVNRKRSCADEQPRSKREEFQTAIAAPRRLLQFAVRDAVATTRHPNPVSEPARKRLRSVVSTPAGNSSEEILPQKMHPVAKVSNSMSTAIRAVAEAAEDVRRAKSGNVFDRLIRGVEDSSELVSLFGEPAVQAMEYKDYDGRRETYVQTRGHSGTYNMNASLIGSSVGLTSDCASDNDGYGNVSGHRTMDIVETGASRDNKTDDSLMVQYNVTQNTDETSGGMTKKGQEPPISAGSTGHKIVNISVNVNTWKPPHYHPARGIVETASSQKLNAENDTGPNVSIARAMRDYNKPVTVIGNGKPAAVFQKEVQETASGPGSNSTAHPLEDADSRTIFINNVHFAATSDTLSRHFSKFGEVLKVMILTDAATSHPKGSAYVEFMRKEAAESALTLNGTSFMSRIIKVIKKNSVQQEASPMINWPRIPRGSSFTVTRFAQAPSPRVFHGAYRGWPAKPGVRRMQWKRDTQQTSVDSVVAVSGNTTNTNTLSAGRDLTYVRAMSKTDGNATS